MGRKISLGVQTEGYGDLKRTNNRRFKSLIKDVDGNSTLIEQTGTDVTILASSLSTVEGRVTDAEASIVVNANAITLKASQSEVTTLTGRVTDAEASIAVNANNIVLAVETAIGGQDSILPYTQENWELGAYSAVSGNVATNVEYIRSKSTINIPILPNTDYVLLCSSLLDFTETRILVFNSSNVFLTSYSFVGGEVKITTPATASYFKVRARKSGGGTFLLTEMPNHSIRVTRNATLQELTNYSTLTQTSETVAIEIGKVKVGGENLVKNSSFANGLANYSASGATVDTTLGYQDSACLKIIGALATTKFAWQQVYAPVVMSAGDTFTMSAYMKGVSIVAGTTNPYVTLYGVVNFLDGTLGYVATSPAISTGTFDWKRLDFTYTIPAGKTLNFIQLYCYARDFTGTVYFDSLQLEQGNKLTGWKPYSSELSGAKYIFDGTRAKFYGDGQEWYDSSGVLKVSFDTVNNRFKFNGEIISDAGTIADFSLIPNYATVLAGTSGKAITAGTGASRVGMSPGVTTSGGFIYSFWAGGDNPQTAPFRVLRNGGLRSDNAIIAGWTMSGTSISKGNTILSASGTNGTLEINGAVLTSSVANRLTLTGSLFISGNTALTNINSGLLPLTNNLYSVGSSTLRWKELWTNASAINSSDMRLKTEIEEIINAQDFILNLKPVQFKLIEGQSGRKHYGFLAQQVKEALTLSGIGDAGLYIDPNITKEEGEEEQMLALRYDEFIAPMIATIQKLEKRISELERVH